jgi:alpha-glucoside transport system substrate-binding protein
MNRPLLRRVALLMLPALAAALTACTGQNSTGSVTILGPWGGTEPGTEGYAFRQVLAAFTAETGIRVNYQDTRALGQVVLSGVQGGTPPDVAVLSSPGELAKYARDGNLYPLDEVIDDAQRAAFSQPWLLPQQKDGVEHIYTVPVKANLKSLVWFNPKRTPGPMPRSWDELVEYTRAIAATGTAPWCAGMGDPPGSGWPGRDLLEDIFLSRFGPDLYGQWVAGTLPWTSDQVREAWTRLGALWGDPRFVHGGPRAVLLTDFGDAGRPMFTEPPGCFLEHQASFIMGFYQGPGYEDLPGGAPEPGTDFDFFPFPAGGLGTERPWLLSVDLAGMFNDTEQARRLMHFLATDKAQRIWPAIAGGGAFMVSKNIDPNGYADPVSRRIAGILKSTDPLCFGASDLTPVSMRNAYSRAVLEFLNDPDQLDSLLGKLDQLRTEIPGDDWFNLPCGR